jgi:hypothetical protein
VHKERMFPQRITHGFRESDSKSISFRLLMPLNQKEDSLLGLLVFLRGKHLNNGQ